MSKIRDTIGFQLANIVKLKRQFIDAEMKALNLTRTQWQALFWINKLGDNCRQQDMLKNMDIDAGHLARVLDHIEQKGYIERKPLEHDRRSVSIHMADYCKEDILPKILSALSKEESILLEGIHEDEIKQLSNLLTKLRINLENTTKSN